MQARGRCREGEKERREGGNTEGRQEKRADVRKKGRSTCRHAENVKNVEEEARE